MKKEDMRNNNVTEENPNRKLPIIIGGVVAAVLVIAIILIVFITSSAKTPQPEVNTATTVTEEPAPTAPAVEETTEPEVEEVVQDKSTLEGWISSISLPTPRVGIWNENQKQGILLEESKDYQIQNGDMILLYHPKAWSEMLYHPEGQDITTGECTKNYTELEIKFEGTVEFSFDLTIVGEKYTAKAILTANEEGSSEVAGEKEVDFNSDMPGKEWVVSIAELVDAPKLAVWNDELGTKAFIEKEAEYQVQEGDQFALISNSKGLYIVGSFSESPLFAREVTSDSIDYLTFDYEKMTEREEQILSIANILEDEKIEYKITLLK